MSSARYGQYNQAGDLSPLYGPDAVALRTLPVVRPLILPYLHKYGGDLGSFSVTGVQDVPLYRAGGYQGTLPVEQQPLLLVPTAWNDPARGQP